MEIFVRKQVDQIGCGVFFNIDDYKLLHVEQNQFSFVCSFSDDYRFDNCEMLLLPDNCWLNGVRTNLVPFYERMELLGYVIEKIYALSDSVELYIGDTGEHTIEEFEVVRSTIQDFPNNMDWRFNNIDSPALHVIFV